MDTTKEDLCAFEAWAKKRAINTAVASAEEIAEWHAIFDEDKRRAPNRKVGLMKLPIVAGLQRWAVVVREGADRWLTFWVQRTPRGEFFLLYPRVDDGAEGADPWNPHASYHLDGRYHQKSHNTKMLPPEHRQPLTGSFKGVERLGLFSGHGGANIGAIVAPDAFSGIVEVPADVLVNNGAVAVDLLEPGLEPPPFFSEFKPYTTEIFTNAVPHVAITVGQFVVSQK